MYFNFFKLLSYNSFFFALKQLFNNFTAKLWVTLYALDPFIMSRILEINHYSVSNIFIIWIFSNNVLHKIKFKTFCFLYHFPFIDSGFIRPHLFSLSIIILTLFFVINFRNIRYIFVSIFIFFSMSINVICTLIMILNQQG